MQGRSRDADVENKHMDTKWGRRQWNYWEIRIDVDAFELRCWRRLLRVPRTPRRSNRSILKEIKPEYSLEGLMLRLQYFGHLMRRTDSLEKTLMLGKTDARAEAPILWPPDEKN